MRGGTYHTSTNSCPWQPGLSSFAYAPWPRQRDLTRCAGRLVMERLERLFQIQIAFADKCHAMEGVSAV
ncbi:unnamed protein product [Periconia digitata]|uniref:Uncharacterized protein n=1 Tax=Periconia digitata TaxID=1303443 RepID=A0A9W4ULS4_9PLEO|nr:unnamed protein product [Periconia digitata]